MNKVVLMGRLTAEPKITYTQGNPSTCIARYTLAVDRRGAKEGQQSADFISCIAFGKGGEFAEKWLRKGMKVAVSGRIQTGSYTNREGQKVFTTDVVLEEQEFAESKNASQQQAKPEPQRNTQEPPIDGAGFMDIPDDIDELPFN